MNTSELRIKVLAEIQQIPEEKLAEVYKLIHEFRVQGTQDSLPDLMEFAGCWNDLPSETYTEFMDDVYTRRQQAFSQRVNRETSLD